MRELRSEEPLQRPRTAYLLLLPFFVFFVVFWLVPLLGGLRMSFYSNELYGTSRFVGGDHYRALLADPRYFKALRNTALYASYSIGCILPLAVLLAHLLQSAWRSIRPFLTFLLLLPALTPPAVLALLFLLVFHGREGLLNQLIVLPLGFKAVNWLKDPSFILPALVLQTVWRWTGFITLFVLAGMDGIPRVLYDAARMSTESRWHLFRTVTYPFLKPVLVFSAVYLMVDAFSLFSGAYVLLGGSGGTADAGLVLVSYIYQQAFTFGKFGTASAISLSVAPFLLLALALCFLRVRRS
jgi:ABC-type sugar transport system permease subunit